MDTDFFFLLVKKVTKVHTHTYIRIYTSICKTIKEPRKEVLNSLYYNQKSNTVLT